MKEEYEYDPPNKYYREGYNLYKRMCEYRDNHLLFLHDKKVPYNNNLSEILLRKYKRKQAQAVSFWSFESIDDLCHGMSVLLLAHLLVHSSSSSFILPLIIQIDI